jgi:hypothetical protein
METDAQSQRMRHNMIRVKDKHVSLRNIRLLFTTQAQSHHTCSVLWSPPSLGHEYLETSY